MKLEQGTGKLFSHQGFSLGIVRVKNLSSSLVKDWVEFATSGSSKFEKMSERNW